MVYRFGRYELDGGRFELREDGVAVPAEPQVLSLLLFLAANRDRMVTKDDQVVETEVLLRGFARIKDVEVAPDGAIYLLLEHGGGGRIIRMVPAD